VAFLFNKNSRVYSFACNDNEQTPAVQKFSTSHGYFPWLVFILYRKEQILC